MDRKEERVAGGEKEVEEGTKGLKRYRNVVFDLGGVLLAWDPQAFLAHMFSDRQPEEVPLDLAHATSLPCWKLLDKGDISREESIALLPASYNKEDYGRFVRGCLPYFTPLPAGINILNQVRQEGYRTYVLSNFHKEYFEGVYERYKDEELCFAKFDGMTISSHVHCIKPHRDIYEHLLQDNGLEAGETLFIDDSEENVAAAQAMGIDALLCKDHTVLLETLRQRGVLKPIGEAAGRK